MAEWKTGERRVTNGRLLKMYLVWNNYDLFSSKPVSRVCVCIHVCGCVQVCAFPTCQLLSEASCVLASSLCSVASFCSSICSLCKASWRGTGWSAEKERKSSYLTAFSGTYLTKQYFNIHSEYIELVQLNYSRGASFTNSIFSVWVHFTSKTTRCQCNNIPEDTVTAGTVPESTYWVCLQQPVKPRQGTEKAAWEHNSPQGHIHKENPYSLLIAIL